MEIDQMPRFNMNGMPEFQPSAMADFSPNNNNINNQNNNRNLVINNNNNNNINNNPNQNNQNNANNGMTNAFGGKFNYSQITKPNVPQSQPQINPQQHQQQNQPQHQPQPYNQLQQQHQQQSSSEDLNWSTLTFSFKTKNEEKKNGTMEMPTNFHCIPLQSTAQPFLFQPAQAQHFTWSQINEQLMSKLFNLQPYFENKVILELGAGFGIPSIISLHLGAKYVYLTDGNDDILNVLPLIMRKNNIPQSKFSTKKLIYNNSCHLREILKDCRKTLKIQNVDILLASDVLDTSENALNFFETVSFYFNIYNEQQRIKFRKRKEREHENKQSTPNVQFQFNNFDKNKIHDIKKPITNGGVLPYLLKPKPKNNRILSSNTKSPNAMNQDQQQQNQSDNTILSHSSHSDDESNSHTTILSNNNNNISLPNTCHLPRNNGNGLSYIYKTPYIQQGSSISAINTVANVDELKITRFNRNQYDQFTQQNKQNQQKGPSKFGIPKYNFNNDHIQINNNCNSNDDQDSDGDSVMFYDSDNKNKNKNKHNDKKSKIKIDKKEEDEFVSKSKINAPILILAHHKKNRNKDVKLKDDGWNTFHHKCLQSGYRCQNVVFEWEYDIWIIKA